ncbi:MULTISPECIES: hypothetical protein [Weeksella]|uniref:hypothetical protein n=1 Tax=Weeksella TaxID=1013 RepID=UPI0008A2D888|nr:MULTISPECIES: hypothetical protein [Weeksella]MDK7376161.1 hypothetical protein [Weeksella virosa]OFM84566.1 hypothetical protein HMPREF2660_08630 [Weeksella sp. HMSC059D05]
MKTYTTSEIAEFNYTVDYASSLPSGYGHRKITVCIIAENGDKKEFNSTTNNMYDFDQAMNLEGQEKYEALFDLVEDNLDGKIAEWLYWQE